ncbi:MAG: SMC-Scp complex subunit ScpB [Thermoguttaceae bacterium]
MNVSHTASSPLAPELLRLEAILFLTREPLPPRRLAVLAELAEGTRVRPLVAQLNRFYDSVQRAFVVVEVAGGFQLRTRPQFAPWLFRLQEVPIEVRLTPSSLETLTMIAYKQPVPRATLESIRGAACGDNLRELLDQDLITIAGRSDDLGRPFLYATTKRFLQVFGLKSLAELPPTSPREVSE